MSERAGLGGGESRPHPEADDRAPVLHEEHAGVGKRSEDVGYVRVRRRVEREKVQREYPRQLEQLAHERLPVDENDSGQVETLPDGSISIPLFEEELVVTKEKVLRERVVIRKETVTAWQNVEAELRRERIEFETDEEDGDRGGSGMQIDKQQIIQMLRERGDHDDAEKAEQQLPDKVDHEEHQSLLQQFGINPQELIGKL